MTLNEYQEKAWATALPTSRNPNYLLLGLFNEVGECAGVVKKHLRGDYADADLIPKLKKELGDAQWYLASLAKSFGFSLEEIGMMNIEKLADRQRRGVLKGNGDNR